MYVLVFFLGILAGFTAAVFGIAVGYYDEEDKNDESKSN